MKVCFFTSDKPRERLLADAWREGIEHHGIDEIQHRPLTGEAQVAEGCDVAVMVGVKSRELYQANQRAGIHVVMVDKGYTRHAAPGPIKLWEYWRVAVDAHHPTAYLMSVARPHDRWKVLGLQLERKNQRQNGGHILLAGSSAKYHAFYGMKEPTAWGRKVVSEIRAITDRPIVYRPKPSWSEAEPIPGTEFSHGGRTIEQDLQNAWCVITHGSNAVFEAQLHGTPTIVLGEAVAKPISQTTIDAVLDPQLASYDQRLQWAANLAYCQWTMKEFCSGAAWAIIRRTIIEGP